MKNISQIAQNIITAQQTSLQKATVCLNLVLDKVEKEWHLDSKQKKQLFIDLIHLLEWNKKHVSSSNHKAGTWVPQLKSNTNTIVTIRRDDFKSDSTFDYIAESLGMDAQLTKAMQGHVSDERDTKLDDYDELEIRINNSTLR